MRTRFDILARKGAPLRFGRWLLLCLLVLVAQGPLALHGFAQTQRPALLPAKAPTFVRSCKVSVPEADPIFPAPEEAKADTAGASDDNESSDDDEDDESDDLPGLILPGSATCIAITGTVNAGIQFDTLRVSRSAPTPPPPASTFFTTGTVRFATWQQLSSGLGVGTAFEASLRTASGGVSELTLDEATVLIGPWTFGLASSRFSFWTGDEFAFSARLPSRSVGLFGWERALTQSWKLALAIEDPTLTSSTTVPVVRGLVPDGVARLVYTQGSWTWHGALALRDVPGPPSRLGRAGIIGATYEATMLGRPGSLTAQIAGAVDGGPYIGSQLDATIASKIVLGTDSTRGFSAVVAARREWTDDLASNLYVSRYMISLPLADASKGKLRIDRLSANLVWTPVTGFKAGIEASLAYTTVAVTDRAVPAGLAGRLFSTQLFIERAF